VVKTLLEAIVLVFLVMYLFLQNLRATLIPTIAVPVVLLGTFGVLAAFGFSINTLTMFGMVLAIGLLVDDAIVVVENVERVMSEEGLPPREAPASRWARSPARWSASALVLSAVFVPMAFFGGSTGVIYRQFSITIVAAMVLSVLVALVLTPALCATMLKPVAKGHGHGEGGWFSGFFGWFNRMFERNTGATNPRRAHSSAQRALPGDLRADRGAARLPVHAHADLLPAGRGSGGDVHPGHAACRRHPGAHHRGPQESRAPLPRRRKGHRSFDLHRRRLQLRRPRPEHGHWLHQYAQLERAQGPGMSVKAIAGRAMAAFRRSAKRWSLPLCRRR
jgi:hypothetical protein